MATIDTGLGASAQPSRITGAHDPIGEFRVELETRRAAEDVIADAIATRKQAAAYAEEIIRHSEALSREIEGRARAAAQIATDEAKARAEQILADAETDAARITTDAELSVARARREEAQHLAEISQRAKRAIGRLEEMASQAQATLEQAEADLVPLAELGADRAAAASLAEDNQPRGGQDDRRRNPFRSLH